MSSQKSEVQTREFDTYEDVAEAIKEDAVTNGYDGPLVMTNGCFDIIHPGHIALLNQCAELAGPNGYVVVAMNSDESIRNIKGSTRPIMDIESRSAIMFSFVQVSYVVRFDEDTPEDLYKAFKPDYIVKGGDYTEDQVVGKEHVQIGVVIVPTVENFSTTALIKKMRHGGN